MKKLFSLIFLTITLIFIGCGGVDSESSDNSTKTINGYVIDEPVVGATMEVYDENGNLIAKKENATDESGKYSITLKTNATKYLIKVSNGKIDNKPFNSKLYSICFENKCNVTPVTTIISLNFAKTLKLISLKDIQNFAQNVLGIDDYQSTNNEEIKKIREYAKSQDVDIDYITGVVVNDLADGYADNNLTTEIFPNAKKREIITKTFQIDTNDIDDYQNRNLKIVNLITGEKVDINQPISYKDFGLNVALVEDYNYTLYDGSEENASSIIYLPFKPYSENKLDINSTIYYYIFLNPKLSNLPIDIKQSLINVLNTKYTNSTEQLRNTYKNYINYGDLYKTKLSSQISLIQDLLIKNELTNYLNSNTTNISQKTVYKTFLKKVINFNDVNKNYMNFGGLSVSYNHTTNKFTFKNMLPKYYGLTTHDVYNSNAKLYNEIISISGIMNSYNDNLVNSNPAGLVGMGISNVFSLISKNTGGEKTPMLCEAFDGDICQQNYLNPNYKQTYVLYSNLKASSLQGVLNGLDIVKSVIPLVGNIKVKYLKETIEELQNINVKRKTKKVFDLLENLSDSIDILLNFTDILAHKDINSPGEVIFDQNQINFLKNLKGNIDETISKFHDLWEYANIDLTDKNTQKESLKDCVIKLFGINSIGYLNKIAKLPLLSNEEVTDKFGFDKLKQKGINKAILFFSFIEGNSIDDEFYNKNILNNKFKYRIYPDKFIQTYIGTLMTVLYYSWGDKNVCKKCIESTIDSLIKKGWLIIPKNQKINYYKILVSIKNHYFDKVFPYIDFKILADTFERKVLNGNLKILKMLSQKIVNFLYSNPKDAWNFVLNYIIIPSAYKAMDNTEGFIKDKLLDTLAKYNIYTQGALAINEIAGKGIAFLAFPNKITFKVRTDESGQNVYFSSGIDGITPIAFEKGIVEPWEDDEIYKREAFLKKPSNNSYYGVIVTSQNDNDASWYRPYFETIFKEPAVEVRSKLDDFDERVFAAINWEYKKCNENSIIDKFDINENDCTNFNNNTLSYLIKGDDIDGGEGGDKYLGYHDKFVLPYPDKNGDPHKNGSYFDFFDYLAVKFSNGKIDTPWGPGLKDSNFTIKNKTRGIYLDKISAQFFAFNNDNDSKFTSPHASDVIFKIANAKEFDYSVDANSTTITITNNSDINLSFLIINSKKFGLSTPPSAYSFDIPANSKKEIPITDVSILGNNLDIIGVDYLLRTYGKFIGNNNLMNIIYSFYNPNLMYIIYHNPNKRYSIADYFNRYSIIDDKTPSGKYPFMRVKQINIVPNNPPKIDDYNINPNNLTATLSVQATDPDNDPLTCSVNWGDGSSDEFNCDENITHTYSNDGEYNVTITATDDKGLSDDISFEVNIKANEITPLNNTGCTLFPGHYPGMWANEYAFAALRKDGTVVTWGDSSSGGDSSSVKDELHDVISIYSNEFGFAALRKNGTVVTWGNSSYGGDSSGVQDELHDVVAIYSTAKAFAALRKDGTVVTWGDLNSGGDSSSVQNELHNVVVIYSTYDAFAALRKDGTVVTWGDWGGDSSSVKNELHDIVAVYSTNYAFAALRKDGTVVTWGNSYSGGNSSSVQNELHDIVAVYSVGNIWYGGAFAALRKDGTVVTWGDPNIGGDSSAVKDELHDVVAIYSTRGAFAALRKDGTVVTWGDLNSGGDSSNVKNKLHDVVAIYSNGRAFAALRKDGTVVTWGYSIYGGDSSNVKNELHDVVAIYSNGGFFNGDAFAALRKDGTVVTWGNPNNGGDSSIFQNELHDVVAIYSTAKAFAALRKDGTVVTWGNSNNGGDSSSVKDELHDVVGFSPSYIWQNCNNLTSSIVGIDTFSGYGKQVGTYYNGGGANF